jgi:hypothetical protein
VIIEQRAEVASTTMLVQQHPGPVRCVARRLFFTCWLIFALHAATNTVREIYPALSIGDHLSFRVDEYAGLHPDIFEKPGFGWHINSNPGASLLGSIPYSAARPVIDRVVSHVNQKRAGTGSIAPEYDSAWPMAREFYKRAWSRGLDIKFGLAGLVMQMLLMAPVSAAATVVMFRVLDQVFVSRSAGLWLAIVYAFGTPVFFRTGYLNQNLLLAHCALLGFWVLWNPGFMITCQQQWRTFFAGLAAGLAVLLDYSGVVLFGCLLIYAICRGPAVARTVVSFAAGSLGPLGLLWFYQWASFGHPLYPAQHWMAAVQWMDRGYQGIGMPEAGMVLANAFDYRYGLFVSCPLLLLAIGILFLNRQSRVLASRELIFCLAFPAALLLFAGSVHYSKLQFNTGVRYMVPAVPLLFILTAAVLVRLPRRVAFTIGSLSVAQAWSMAMYRDVERGAGAFEPVLRVFLDGFQLPALAVLSRMGGQYGEYAQHGASPLPLFAITGVILYAIWSDRLTGSSK